LLFATLGAFVVFSLSRAKIGRGAFQGGTAQNSSKTNVVPDSMHTELRALFQRYYPKPANRNEQFNGSNFVYELTVDHPNAGSNNNHEGPVQPGPKRGVISCQILFEKGNYLREPSLRLDPVDGGGFGEVLIDRGESKLLIMVPYSTNRNAYLYV